MTWPCSACACTDRVPMRSMTYCMPRGLSPRVLLLTCHLLTYPLCGRTQVVYKWGSLISFIMIIAWPLLALPARVFPKGYFAFWVVISIVWGLLAAVVAIVMPVWEVGSSDTRALEGLSQMWFHSSCCGRLACKHTLRATLQDAR